MKQHHDALNVPNALVIDRPQRNRGSMRKRRALAIRTRHLLQSVESMDSILSRKKSRTDQTTNIKPSSTLDMLGQ